MLSFVPLLKKILLALFTQTLSVHQQLVSYLIGHNTLYMILN